MKVLVVDDDVVSRMVLMHLVDSCGTFEILEAEDGQEAWEMLEQGLQPAVIFCDLRMPRMSGMELLQNVKGSAATRSVPFILVSSATDEETVAQATSSGASGYIVKPFQVEQVRVHLAAFSDSPGVPDFEAEPPLATQQRLGINGERLLVYLGGFQSQLTAAGGDIDVLLSRGDVGGAMARIERLHAGCLTLGLTGAAHSLKALVKAAPSSDEVHAVLAEIVRAVLHQSELARSA
jgi:two-component system chemotaxis response regulator CheY